MKFGSKEIIDLYVFNEEGNQVAKLDTLKESYITTSRVVVRDALLNVDMLKFLGKEEINPSNDYERLINNNASSNKTIVLNNKLHKKCKLIAKSYLRSQQNGNDIPITYEIPNVFVSDNFTFENNVDVISDYDLSFEIEPFNSQGDTIKVHIQGV